VTRDRFRFSLSLAEVLLDGVIGDCVVGDDGTGVMVVLMMGSGATTLMASAAIVAGYIN
jgi:hypothetical protein